MLTSKLAISGQLRCLVRTQSRARVKPREAAWPRPAPSSHSGGPLPACCRRQGNDLTLSPTIGTKSPGRETAQVRQRPGQHPHLRSRGRQRNQPGCEGAVSQLGRCPVPGLATSSAPASPGRRRWPPSCKGAGPYPAPGTPCSDWLIPVVTSYDWLSANHPSPTPGAPPGFRSRAARVPAAGRTYVEEGDTVLLPSLETSPRRYGQETILVFTGRVTVAEVCRTGRKWKKEAMQRAP